MTKAANAIMILPARGARKKLVARGAGSCFRFQTCIADEGTHLGIIRRYNLGDELRADGVYLILS
jgi:hypothetical protein